MSAIIRATPYDERLTENCRKGHESAVRASASGNAVHVGSGLWAHSVPAPDVPHGNLARCGLCRWFRAQMKLPGDLYYAFSFAGILDPHARGPWVSEDAMVADMVRLMNARSSVTPR